MTRRKLLQGVVALLLFVCMVLPRVTQGYSNGAPDVACNHMVPGHGNKKPQDTPSPYRIQIERLDDKANRRIINVTLDSDKGLAFKGFLLQARPDTGGNAIGSFLTSTAVSNAHTCGSGKANSVTHVNSNPKKRVVLEWEAPDDYTGVLVFNATFVGDYSTFWTGVMSNKFRVTARSEGPLLNLETTSRRPTISTSTSAAATTSQPTTSLPVTSLSSSIYIDCGVTKSCFGFGTPNCLESHSCDGLVTYQLKADKYEFELLTSAPQLWVGAALSDDQNMGSDSVMECTYENGRVFLHSSWNGEIKGSNHRIPDDSSMQLLNSSYVDSTLYCRFTRDQLFTVEGVDFDLARPYYLLVAGGATFKENSVGYHDTSRASTADKIILSDVTQVKSASKILVRLHGAFMLLAWIGTASCGILLARYFKQTWVGSQLCGKDQWFAWHRILMVTTWCLTVAGFIIIFIELQAWSSAENPHAIIGVITMALAFIQPFMAALRPHPGAPRRALFNWFHWLVGNLAHICAIVAIFFAVLLPRADLPNWMLWILVAFVAFHVCMHLIFSIVGCASDRQGGSRVTAFPMKDMGANRNSLHGVPDRRQDAPHSTLRKLLLAFYILGAFGLAIALIVITVLAPIENTWKDVKTMVGWN